MTFDTLYRTGYSWRLIYSLLVFTTLYSLRAISLVYILHGLLAVLYRLNQCINVCTSITGATLILSDITSYHHHHHHHHYTSTLLVL